MGASVAYFLSQLGIPSLLVERAEPACAASGACLTRTCRGLWQRACSRSCTVRKCAGKAGGFLALSWLDDGPVGQLCRRSYHLHAQLAGQLEGDLGFRRVTTAAISLSDAAQPAGALAGRSC